MIAGNIVLIPSLKIKSEFYYLFVLDGLLVIFQYLFYEKIKVLLLYTGGTIGMIENPASYP